MRQWCKPDHRDVISGIGERTKRNIVYTYSIQHRSKAGVNVYRAMFDTRKSGRCERSENRVRINWLKKTKFTSTKLRI